MNTVRMAAAALRSAADDLGKSPTSRMFDLSMTSRIVADKLANRDTVALQELRFLVLDIAQILDRPAGLEEA